MQRTLRTQIDVVGVGLHTGQRIRMRIEPAGPGSGIRFYRDDLNGAFLALNGRTPIGRADHATTLAGDGFSITTVEHLLAALGMMGVDNAAIRLSSDEVPIMDGSSAPFVYLIREAGLRSQGLPRRAIRVTKPIGILDGDREVTIYPADDMRVTYTIDFAHASIGRQTMTRVIDRRTFGTEIAPARTFCLLQDVQALRERGLALGGSLANAVVVGDAGPLNGLRFHDEFIRHKILDLLGDLALMGRPVLGHVVAHKAGHALHAALIQRLQRETDSWVLAEMPETVPSHRSRPSMAEGQVAALSSASSAAR